MLGRRFNEAGAEAPDHLPSGGTPAGGVVSFNEAGAEAPDHPLAQSIHEQLKALLQ